VSKEKVSEEKKGAIQKLVDILKLPELKALDDSYFLATGRRGTVQHLLIHRCLLKAHEREAARIRNILDKNPISLGLTLEETLKRLHDANIGFHGIDARDIESVMKKGLNWGGYHRVHREDVEDTEHFMREELPKILRSIVVLGGSTKNFGLLLIDLNKANVHSEIPVGRGISRVIAGSGDLATTPKEAIIGGVSITPVEYRQIKGQKLDGNDEVMECFC